jgi:hypothetical protein
MRSFSGGGGNSAKSFSGGGSGNNSRSRASSGNGLNAPSARSFSGNSGRSNRSGDSGNNSSFSRTMRELSKANRGNSGRSNYPSRSFSNRGDNQPGLSNDATQQYRGYRAPSGEGNARSFLGGSNNNSARSRGNNEQLQQMFKQYREQQASANVEGRSVDRSQFLGRTGGSNSGRNQLGSNELPGQAGDGNRGRVDWNRMGGNEAKNGERSRGGGQFGNGGGNNGNRGGSDVLGNVDGRNLGDSAGKGPGSGQFARGDSQPGDFNRGDFNRGDAGRGNNKGSGNFGQWSRKDGGKWNAKTAEWYGKSGFGDHRGRGYWGDGKGEKGNWSKGDWNRSGGNRGDWNKGNWNRDGKGHGDRRHDWGDHVRNDWNKNWSNKHGRHDWDWHRGRNWRDVPFAYGWWGGRRNWGYNYYWTGWRSNPWYWWGGCNAPLLTTWVDFGWNTPCYWDYGPGEYITYYNNTVYVDNQRYATALDYYAQVRNLARSVPALTKAQLANIEWLPLGVFAVTRPDGQQSNELIQLAVSKDGILSGTWFDQATGQSRPLQGMVEQATQKAAWTFADSPTDALVVETSLYNLTEPECSALAHLDAVSSEVWQLTRLEQPKQPAVAQPPVGVVQPPQANVAPPAGAANAPAPGPADPAPALKPVQPVVPPQDDVQ